MHVNDIKIGDVFGRWIVLDTKTSVDKYWKYKHLVVCECGIEKECWHKHLISGKSRGCYKCAKTKHGFSGTRLNTTYNAMISRCYNKNNDSFSHYGGKGIEVCKEWKESFLVFKKWADANGYKDDLTIERLDNNKNYCSNNCTWKTIQEQATNRSNNVLYELNGIKKCISEWSRDDLCEINLPALYYRLKKGINIKTAMKKDMNK